MSATGFALTGEYASNRICVFDAKVPAPACPASPRVRPTRSGSLSPDFTDRSGSGVLPGHSGEERHIRHGATEAL